MALCQIWGRCEVNINFFFIFVEPPIFTLKPSSVIQARRGSTVNLCCEAAGSPPSKIKWSRAQWSPNERVLVQENGCLIINTAKEKGSGSYICRATNSYGVTQTTTTLIVSGQQCFASVYDLI